MYFRRPVYVLHRSSSDELDEDKLAGGVVLFEQAMVMSACVFDGCNGDAIVTLESTDSHGAVECMV